MGVKFQRCFLDVKKNLKKLIYIIALVKIFLFITFYYNKTYILDLLSIVDYVPNLSCLKSASTWSKENQPVCKSFAYDAIITPADICTKGDIELLVMVTSRPNAIELRNAIRETYGRDENVLFVFGRETTEIDLSLRSESSKYNDIVQFDFRENYYNLTLKSIMLLKWASKQSCVRYIMKSDDDSYNFIPKIKEQLRDIGRDEIAGFCFRNHANRNSSNRFYADRHAYPVDTYLPVYCNGPCYLMSRHAASTLVDVAPTIRLIEIEDIFVTGFCRHETGLSYRHIDKFGQTLSWQTECKLRYQDTWQIHKVDTVELYHRVHAWIHQIGTTDRTCPLPYRLVVAPLCTGGLIWLYVLYAIFSRR